MMLTLKREFRLLALALKPVRNVDQSEESRIECARDDEERTKQRREKHQQNTQVSA